MPAQDSRVLVSRDLDLRIIILDVTVGSRGFDSFLFCRNELRGFCCIDRGLLDSLGDNPFNPLGTARSPATASTM